MKIQDRLRHLFEDRALQPKAPYGTRSTVASYAEAMAEKPPKPLRSDTVQVKRVEQYPRVLHDGEQQVDVKDLLVTGEGWGRYFVADCKQNRSYATTGGGTLYHVFIAHPLLVREHEFTVAPSGDTRATFQDIGVPGAVRLWLHSKMTRILQGRIESDTPLSDLQQRMRARMHQQARELRCKARRTSTRARQRTHRRLVEEYGASRAAALMTRYPDIWGYE